MILDVVGSWLPLWAGDSLGVGIGGSIGVKYDQVGASNGNVSFSRFPFTASAQMLFGKAPTYMLLHAGMINELGANLSGNGLAAGLDVDLSSGWGQFVDWGVRWGCQGRAACALKLRYTNMHFDVGGGRIHASNFGALFGIYYTL